VPVGEKGRGGDVRSRTGEGVGGHRRSYLRQPRLTRVEVLDRTLDVAVVLGGDGGVGAVR